MQRVVFSQFNSQLHVCYFLAYLFDVQLHHVPIRCTDARRINIQEQEYVDANFMFPCWLIVSNVSGATTSLRDSITSSGYRRLLSDASSGILSVSQRETTVILPKTVVGRYVRIQRQDPLYLSIAEVEVYSDRTRVGYCHCSRGSGLGVSSCQVPLILSKRLLFPNLLLPWGT